MLEVLELRSLIRPWQQPPIGRLSLTHLLGPDNGPARDNTGPVIKRGLADAVWLLDPPDKPFRGNTLCYRCMAQPRSERLELLVKATNP